MVRRKVKIYFLIPFTGMIVAILALGCSAKSTPKSSDGQMQKDEIYDTLSTMVFDSDVPDSDVPESNVLESNRQVDTIPTNQQSHSSNVSTSGIDLSVNPYYDAGYEQGYEDGYNDGVENLRGDSYDDGCRYKGRKRKEYELGYEEGYDSGFDDGFADSGYDSEDEE